LLDVLQGETDGDEGFMLRDISDVVSEVDQLLVFDLVLGVRRFHFQVFLEPDLLEVVQV